MAKMMCRYDEGSKQTPRIGVILAPAQRIYLQEMADATGMSISQQIRHMIEAQAIRSVKGDGDAA